MFISARSEEGTSSVAASFALMAASRTPRAAWLIDLDFRRNPVFRAFKDGFTRDCGAPGRAYDASLGVPPIYTISPAAVVDSGRTAASDKLLTVHKIAKTRLMVTRFRNERLRQGQRVQLRTQRLWWQTLRQAADWIIVDSPALERSGAGLVFAGQMDGVVLVVRADKTTAEEVVALRQEVEAHGGEVLGVVMNQVKSDAALADRFA